MRDSLIACHEPKCKFSFSGRLWHVVKWAIRTLALALVTGVVVRFLLVRDGDDDDDAGHMLDLLKVKLLGPAYRTFHTQLYLCSEVFDFLPVRIVSFSTLTYFINIMYCC